MARLFGDTILRALDANGEPVSGGRAYVYLAGTTTPVTTYSDAALTTPHAYPVVADSSGVFAPIYVLAGAYKVAIKTPADADLPGSPVDNIAAGALDAPTIAGVPSDDTDASSALSAALNDASRTLFDGGGKTIRVDSLVTATRTAPITLRNFTLDLTNASGAGLVVQGAQGTGSALTADATRGDLTVTVANGALFAVDQWVFIQSAQVWNTSQSVVTGHYARIRAISGNDLTLFNPLFYDFAVADTATVYPMTLPKRVVVENVEIIGANLGTTAALRLRYTDGAVVENLRADGHAFAACIFDRSVNFEMGGGVIERGRHASTLSYGVGIYNGCHAGLIDGLRGSDLRHTVTGGDTDGVNTSITVHGVKSHGSRDAGVDCHAAGDLWTISDCTVEVAGYRATGNSDGIIFQGPRCKMTGNTIRGAARKALFHQMIGGRVPGSSVITGNQVFDGVGSEHDAVSVFAAPDIGGQPMQSVVISANACDGTARRHIEVDAQTADIGAVTIGPNTMTGAASGVSVLVEAASGRTITNVAMTGGVYTGAGNETVWMLGTGAITRASVRGATILGGTNGIRLTGVGDFREGGNTITASTRLLVSSATAVRADHPGEATATGTAHTVAADTGALTCAQSGTLTVTLPSAAQWPGRELTLRNTVAFAVQSASSNVVPITNATTPTTAILAATDGAWARLRSNGTNWVIVAGVGL